MEGSPNGKSSPTSPSPSSLQPEHVGPLWVLARDGAWAKLHAVIRKNALSCFSDETKLEPVMMFTLVDCTIQVPRKEPGRKYTAIISDPRKDKTGVCTLGFETADSCEEWLDALSCATVSYGWPGGIGISRRFQSLSMSYLAKDPTLASPLLAYPAVKTAPSWQRRSLLLRKFRLCSVVFEGYDTTSFSEQREMKRQTLQEIVGYYDTDSKVFMHNRVLDDVMTMIRMNLFRSLPKPPPANCDPDDDPEPFSDPQWPHLVIVYELLLHLVSNDAISVVQKKRMIDTSFVRQLLLLFDSEDFRERDYLKNITHRIYSKLTQRRALIRRVICNIFFEFVFETDTHNGVSEMLEILASIINGFCVPIKDEHKVMLVRALIPLHKSANVGSYHPQLSYCMVLYASKDHTLTREIITGMLKFWPNSNSGKQTMFLNELEDLFEYVQPDDLEALQDLLATRLVKSIGGLHFQVAERTLCLWNSDRFSRMVLETESVRKRFLPGLFPILYGNSVSHWHESVRTLSTHVLQLYLEVDSELYASCAQAWEASRKPNAKIPSDMGSPSKGVAVPLGRVPAKS